MNAFEYLIASEKFMNSFMSSFLCPNGEKSHSSKSVIYPKIIRDETFIFKYIKQFQIKCIFVGLEDKHTHTKKGKEKATYARENR